MPHTIMRSYSILAEHFVPWNIERHEGSDCCLDVRSAHPLNNYISFSFLKILISHFDYVVTYGGSDLQYLRLRKSSISLELPKNVFIEMTVPCWLH